MVKDQEPRKPNKSKLGLICVSALDGRYSKQTEDLSEYFSENALIFYRLKVEISWLCELSIKDVMPEMRETTVGELQILDRLLENLSLDDSFRVKEIERATNHDVKAIEYLLREKMADTTLADLTPWIHFACTSEDINNLAYAMMLRDGVMDVWLTKAKNIIESIVNLSQISADQPMLSRTHGQSATPTTLGKEMAVFVHRLRRQLKHIEAQEYLGKMNGAVGAFNAHVAAYPDVDWQTVAKDFVEEQLGLTYNPLTTQIEPHDWIAELFHSLMRFQTILLDFVRDVWQYISLGYLKQRVVASETGSSTMPHKVNPIDFENAEANIGLSNALLDHLASKLPVSRLQRDLSDSSAIRNVGSAIAYGYIALQSIQRGLGKIDVNVAAIEADLAANPEVLAEAIQTVLRKHGIADAYEQLKDLTRGTRLTLDVLRDFVRGLAIPDDDKQRLLAMEPRDYVGLAPQLARLG